MPACEFPELVCVLFGVVECRDRPAAQVVADMRAQVGRVDTTPDEQQDLGGQVAGTCHGHRALTGCSEGAAGRGIDIFMKPTT